MKKIEIKIYRIGNLFKEIDFKKLENTKSTLFSITEEIETLTINQNTEGVAWQYLDLQLNNIIPDIDEKKLSICLIDHPLEGNYYIRKLSKNKIAMSIYEIKDILKSEEIPINNFIIRNLYELALVFISHKLSLPENTYALAHHENRGCLFDMNLLKEYITKSCVQPILCDECYVKYKSLSISVEVLNRIRKEIKTIDKDRFTIIKEFVQKKPLLSLLITSIFAIILNLISSSIFELLRSFNYLSNSG